MIPLSHYLILGAILFSISIVGIFLNRKNVVILLMSIELLLLAVNMNFVAFSHYLQRFIRTNIRIFHPHRSCCRSGYWTRYINCIV